MSGNADIKKVTETARDAVQRINAKAAEVQDKFRKATDSVDDALSAADDYAEGLIKLGAELRGFLGEGTNFPPDGDQ